MNRAERNAARRQRELEKRKKEAAKLEALERARLEVEFYENTLDVLTSLHVDVGPSISWPDVVATEPPLRDETAVASARLNLESYRPSRLFKKSGERKHERLVAAVAAAESAADKAHSEAIDEQVRMTRLARAILDGEPSAQLDVLAEFAEISEVAGLGERLRFSVDHSGRVLVALNAHSADVIPVDVKSLLKSGRMSVKKMPVGRRWELYQDHICSAAIRVARDTLALLPVDMVFVTVVDELLNGATGFLEEQAVLSVAIPRDTLTGLNLEQIDPSDSMSNFVHRMDFRKTKGFRPVEPIMPADLA